MSIIDFIFSSRLNSKPLSIAFIPTEVYRNNKLAEYLKERSYKKFVA